MIRAELYDDRCSACEARLSEADHFERVDVIYGRGEYEGEPGVAVLAFCRCGTTSVIPFSVNQRPAT